MACIGELETEIEVTESIFMGVPKRRMSKMRLRTRKAANRPKSPPQLSVCSQCGARVRPHRVCPSCGYYKGRQVVSVTTG
jgi:large subunit ribosomal protein L32